MLTEKLSNEKLLTEKLLNEKLEKEKLEKERLDREQLQKYKILNEKLIQEKLLHQKLMDEKLEKETLSNNNQLNGIETKIDKLINQTSPQINYKLDTLEEFRLKVEQIKNHYTPNINRTTVPAILKSHVWDLYIGSSIGEAKCFCCRKNPIKQISFVCGHVISRHNSGPDIIENLRPICSLCNSSMGTSNMYIFIYTYDLWGVSPTNLNNISLTKIEDKYSSKVNNKKCYDEDEDDGSDEDEDDDEEIIYYHTLKLAELKKYVKEKKVKTKSSNQKIIIKALYMKYKRDILIQICDDNKIKYRSKDTKSILIDLIISN